MRIQWTKALSTGNPLIDAQHQELFARADRLAAGVGAKSGEVRTVVDFLHAYAVEHFGLEEAYMRDHRFPGYERHKAQHDRFIEDLLVFAQDLEEHRGNARLGDRVAKWLASWLEEHVKGTDVELAAFLAKKSA